MENMCVLFLTFEKKKTLTLQAMNDTWYGVAEIFKLNHIDVEIARVRGKQITGICDLYTCPSPVISQVT